MYKTRTKKLISLWYHMAEELLEPPEFNIGGEYCGPRSCADATRSFLLSTCDDDGKNLFEKTKAYVFIEMQFLDTVVEGKNNFVCIVSLVIFQFSNSKKKQ